MANQEKLNPDVKEINVGVETLHSVKIYPLSISDQKKLTNSVVDIVQKFSEVDFSSISNEEAFNFLRELVFDNIEVLLEYITKEEERPSLDELTNAQLSQIIDIVFEVNFEVFIKNYKNLLQKFQQISNK